MSEKKKKESIDLNRLSDIMVKFSHKQRSVLSAMSQKNKSGNLNRDMTLMSDFMEVMMNVSSNPETLFSAQSRFARSYMNLTTNYMKKFWNSGNRNDQSDIKPSDAKHDKRFVHEEWSSNPFFEFLRDFYLTSADNLHRTVASVSGVSEQKKRRVEFFTRQMTDAMSPSNFIFTNPELLRLTLETKGGNIIEGIDNLLDDVNCGDGHFTINMTDKNAFEIGRNLATTPGKIVFQNDLIQLIQYSPSTEKVRKTPVLISPPWINKYYILDLNEKNSLVKWLVDKGYTVFMVSWVNPDKRHAEKTYQDYVIEGILAAVDAAGEATGETRVSAIGYCTGGTLLATTAAYLEATGEDRFASLTYMATLMDFSDPGDIGVFLDNAQVERIIDDIKDVGYLDGRHLARTFNMLRPNDLIWSYAVRNYIKGENPVPFDILYWNSDSTNLPAGMYGFFLKNMYVENRLRVPGGITVKGVPIDLGAIKTPSYFLTTEEDHIVLWKSAYSGALLHSGMVRFILGGSGHVAGVVNPPEKNKYGYRHADSLPACPEEWFKAATWVKGSWWTDWEEWNRPFSGGEVDARTPGEGSLKALMDAPGSYVKRTVGKKARCREICSCHSRKKDGITEIQPYTAE